MTVSGSTVTITKSGTYVISGQSDGVQIKVEADKSADVHLVLKGATMTNTMQQFLRRQLVMST